MHSPEQTYQAVPGSVVLVDISGFTKLSEALAKQGKLGAEELAATIGASFIPLLELIYANGGRLLKFGGDALLLLFTGSGHEQRAAVSAFDARAELRRIGHRVVLGRRVDLRMSVGIHSGTFDLFLVGGSHRELVITGPDASSVVLMEQTATAGQIVVSSSTAAALPPDVLGGRRGDGVLLRRRPELAGPSIAARDPVPSGVDLSSCVPLALRPAVLGRARDPEHRRVAVAFLRFCGVDGLISSEGPKRAADRLEVLLRSIQEVVDRRGLTFLGTDVDHDGGKIILVAGAPVSSGDDVRQMLRALREIVEQGSPLVLKCGVNYGDVFAGDIGPEYRRTFTVMGDTVNLAARLMARAEPNTVLASQAMIDRAIDEFELNALEPFTVKGKSRPVTAFELGAHRRAPRHEAFPELAMLGRKRELEVLAALARSASAGRGAVVEIVGEPGIGKSRLVSELAARTNLQLRTVVSEQYESSNPYQTIRRFLLDVLHDGSGDLASTIRRRLEEADPGLVSLAPLVARIVGVEMAESAETLGLAEEFRAARSGEVVTALLRTALPTPTLLMFDDAHWMDGASGELLSHLAHAASEQPWLICVCRRDLATPFAAEEATRLHLGALERFEAIELVHLATRERPLPAHQMEQLVERASGNPLFLIALAGSMRRVADVDALPDSIDGLIASQIDAMSIDDRQFLRRISVPGEKFSTDLLDAVLEEVPAPNAPTWARLERFIEYGDGQVSFISGLVRESAYNGLSYRMRRQLHARCGDRIAALSGGDTTAVSGLLSLHYLEAERFAEAWRYSLVAAEAAQAIFANVESALLYERALEAARGARRSVKERASVYEGLGDARYRASAYASSADAYRAARRLAGGEPVAQARLQLKLARAMGRLDRYANALRWITAALRTLDAERGHAAARLRAELVAWYGRFCQEGGHHRRALEWSKRAIDAAEKAGDKDALANALKVLDWALMDLGLLEEPENWRRAIDLFGDLGDLASQSTLLNGLGMHAYFRGQWVEALGHYEQSRQAARRAGDAVLEAVEINNIAEIVLEQGRLDEAERLFTDVLRAWRAAGYRSGEASVTCNLARVASGRRDFETAASLFDDAIAGAQRVGGLAELLEAQARKAESLLASGDVSAALELVGACIDRSKALGGIAPQAPLLQRLRGAALVRLGEIGEGIAALRRSVEAAQSRHAEHELALTLHLSAQLGAQMPGLDAEKVSAEILDRLDIVWVLDLSGTGRPVLVETS